ncbi:peroxiredoxin [Streptomyces sp. TRM66268-LWL]|uniref:thioredoxin-dependent peroxiredoxin n=1 Tax=Streptomyces polyasparticus TaxID=2767826 RepID=A0ABR7SUS1_9ACTN|nr:peroxiredoxin [Streptomyces polyasparticus]MBC9719254.1 peroxiredoxin [Streptomyces polyasparticus]
MARSPQLGEHVPDFSLPGGRLTDGHFLRRDYELCSQRGRPIVLAFYPGDGTPVCTRQLCSYSHALDGLNDLGAEVWAISPQGMRRHERFARRHDLRMPLLSDADLVVARMFGITRPGLGLRRSVFLIAADGTLRWKHVSWMGVTFQSAQTLKGRIAAITES